VRNRIGSVCVKVGTERLSPGEKPSGTQKYHNPRAFAPPAVPFRGVPRLPFQAVIQLTANSHLPWQIKPAIGPSSTHYCGVGMFAYTDQILSSSRRRMMISALAIQNLNDSLLSTGDILQASWRLIARSDQLIQRINYACLSENSVQGASRTRNSEDAS
jgi:hypothetical protein